MAKPKEFPEQSQDAPGEQSKMVPQPEIINANYKGSGKLEGKTAAAIQSDAGQDSLASVVLRLGFIMVPTGSQVDSVERALAHGRRLAEVTKMLRKEVT